jgi:hypothetical protein
MAARFASYGFGRYPITDQAAKLWYPEMTAAPQKD